MVQRRQRERSLFEVLLPDGHKLWPDWLRKIDTLLEDDGVIDSRHARAGKRRISQGWPPKVLMPIHIIGAFVKCVTSQFPISSWHHS